MKPSADFHPSEGRWYHHSGDVTFSFEDGEEYCESIPGARLAVPSSKEDHWAMVQYGKK